MKAIFIKAGLLAAAGALALGIGAAQRPSTALAQGMSSMAPAPAIECTDAWLKGAMGRLSAEASGMKYSGDVDKDAAAALMMVMRVENQALAYETKCGKNDKMKAMATSMKASSDQKMQALMATTQTLY